MGAFHLLTDLTARLASTERFDEIIDTVLRDIVAFDFGAVWMAVLDEETGRLSTLKEIVDGIDTTHEMPALFVGDRRLPIGQGFLRGQMVSITDPSSLHIIEHDDDPTPPDKLVMHRVVLDHLRDRPFACGPLLGRRGQPVGALGLSSYRGKKPIPESLFSQRLLRAFMDHLGIAMERALYVARLRANLTRAQEASISDARLKAVGELAAGVAHDIKNLSGIALLAVGAGSRSPADAVAMLAPIERANRRIRDHVARLHRIARSTSSEPEIADLQQIIDDILIMMAPILREQSIEIDASEQRPMLPLVRCDAVVVHQVVLNLLLNAKDALGQVPPDRRRITIRARDDGGGVVRLSVVDSGPGIAPAVLGQLFQRIVSTKDNAHHGLGLFSAQTALEKFGGQIEVRNAPTGGAVFEVTLVAAAPGTPDPSPAIRPPPTSAEKKRRGRILAVDDDPDIVFVIRANLEPIGYEVVTATDPVQAIAEAMSQVFDLVLCDFGMPHRSGLDVCHALRAADYRGKLVLMTGYETEKLGTDGRGCDMLLKKPFLAPELIDVIDTLLEGSSASTGSHATPASAPFDPDASDPPAC